MLKNFFCFFKVKRSIYDATELEEDDEDFADTTDLIDIDAIIAKPRKLATAQTNERKCSSKITDTLPEVRSERAWS